MVVDVPEPQAGPGQVVLEVLGAGLCHSDLVVMGWPADRLPFPLLMTLGREGAGAQGVFDFVGAQPTVDLARTGLIGLHGERNGTDEAPAACARLHEGKVRGRAVVAPSA